MPPPFELRTLTRYEIADGCPLIDDKIPFTIPLKGMDHLTPTLKNVINKFSVRYFIKLGITEQV
jgi:vacuolar protein sorting-associated protein 26